MIIRQMTEQTHAAVEPPLSSHSTFNLTEGAHPWSRPAEEVAAVVDCGQKKPDESYVPERSPHSFFRI